MLFFLRERDGAGKGKGTEIERGKWRRTYVLRNDITSFFLGKPHLISQLFIPELLLRLLIDRMHITLHTRSAERHAHEYQFRKSVVVEG